MAGCVAGRAGHAHLRRRGCRRGGPRAALNGAPGVLYDAVSPARLPGVRRGELARARFVCPLGIYPLGGLLSMRPWGRASARVSVVTCGEGPVTITMRGTPGT